MSLGECTHCHGPLCIREEVQAAARVAVGPDGASAVQGQRVPVVACETCGQPQRDHPFNAKLVRTPEKPRATVTPPQEYVSTIPDRLNAVEKQLPAVMVRLEALERQLAARRK